MVGEPPVGLERHLAALPLAGDEVARALGGGGEAELVGGGGGFGGGGGGRGLFSAEDGGRGAGEID